MLFAQRYIFEHSVRDVGNLPSIKPRHPKLSGDFYRIIFEVDFQKNNL